MNMITVIRVPVAGQPSVLQIPREDFNHRACELIGCECFDFPRTQFSPDLHLVVDDEGLMVGKPVNPVASVLYSAMGVIVGDALLVQVGLNEDGEPDVVDMDLMHVARALEYTNTIAQLFKED